VVWTPSRHLSQEPVWEAVPDCFPDTFLEGVWEAVPDCFPDWFLEPVWEAVPDCFPDWFLGTSLGSSLDCFPDWFLGTSLDTTPDHVLTQVWVASLQSDAGVGGSNPCWCHAVCDLVATKRSTLA
jgi:hypothetical protein